MSSDYFTLPPRSAGLPGIEDEDEGGMVTGQGSTDTVAPLNAKRKKRKEELEEDDSSELSDDSEDEEEGKRAAAQIKFSKAPVRIRSGSSPLHPSKLKDEVNEDDVKLIVTSPSRPPEAPTIRRGSLSQVDVIKQRARRDTATSSEWSSENEVEPLMFRRQKVQSRGGPKQTQILPDPIVEEPGRGDSDLEDEVSDASDLSDGFDEPGETDSLNMIGAPLIAIDTLSGSPKPLPPNIPPAVTPHNSSPRKKSIPMALPRLPTGRPISYVQPVSLLSKALKSNIAKGESPFQQFAPLSGKGDAQPLWIKIYAPFSENSEDPFEVPIRRSKENGQIIVADLIGLSLWRYIEEKREPTISNEDSNVNRWTLRMVDDGEVEMDFPALGRARPVFDFTSNNNRPARGRSRDKPWDEFALVRATDEELAKNEEITPQFGAQSQLASAIPTPEPSRTHTPIPMIRQGSDNPAMPSYIPNRNPITGPNFQLSAMRKDSTAPPLDAPTNSAQTSTPRNGVAKTVTIHYTDPNSFQTTVLPIPTTSDTYIAELFNLACQRLSLSKALFVLKVRGTQTVAPQDRTVEALGERLHLDLQRRRFVGVDERGGSSGSPGSESPNAPLLLTTGTTPTKTKKTRGFGMLTTRPGLTETASSTALNLGPGGKRYQVIRRQPLSFAPSHPRILALDGEYVHIMPAADPDGGGGVASGKTSSVHFSSVIGCKVSRKHPKIIRMLVWREKETKRYDFEASSPEEAADIAGEVKRGVEKFGNKNL